MPSWRWFHCSIHHVLDYRSDTHYDSTDTLHNTNDPQQFMNATATNIYLIIFFFFYLIESNNKINKRKKKKQII